MHYEIFLDLLFAENLLLNYTILRLSSFLLKRSATRRRSFAAAALGAGYAVLYAVFARYLPGALLALVGIGITTGMVKSGCRITTVRDLVVGMAGYILSGFLIGSAYRLFRELMPGEGEFFRFSSFRECRICGNTPPAEDPKGDAPGTRQAGYGTACAEWEMEKSKRTVRHGQYFAGCHNQKAGLGRTVHCDTRIVPGRNADRDAALARHETVLEPERLLALAAPLHTVRGLEGRGFLPVIRISEMILVTEHTARHISGPLIALGGENSSSPRGYEIILHPDLMEGQEE